MSKTVEKPEGRVFSCSAAELFVSLLTLPGISVNRKGFVFVRVRLPPPKKHLKPNFLVRHSPAVFSSKTQKSQQAEIIFPSV